MSRNLKRLTLILVCLATLIAVGVGVVRFSMAPVDGSNDAELEANFGNHEADFQLLVEMSRSDPKVVRITDDFTWLDTNAAWPRAESEWGFSGERWEDYRNLFNKVGVSGGLLRDNGEGITYFIVSSRGLITNGSHKGYAYCESEAATPVVLSLDDATLWPKDKRVVFKRLKGHWYLFHMSA